MSGPLADVNVLDVTQVLSGSFATMMLGDLGAEVVKIERPGRGDIARSNPPFVGEQSAYFLSLNRNKQSVALDLSSNEGQEIFLDLAAEADVIVENLKPGTMDQFGLGYEDVTARNEDIIYCSISGFGQTGPHADLPALDIIVQAFSGNMSITGPSDGQPYRSGIPIGDIAGSMYAVQSVLAALHARSRTGDGEYLDVSMADGLMSWLTVRAGYTFATGQRYPRMGNELEEFVPYGAFETADSYLVIAVVQDHHWARLQEAVDEPVLTEDRFETMESRREHREELEELLAQALQERSTDKWFELLSDAGVPVAPVNDTHEIWGDEHVQARNLEERIDVNGDSTSIIRPPVSFSEQSSPIRLLPPKLGEHSHDVLRELGYDDETINTLAEEGIIEAESAE